MVYPTQGRERVWLKAIKRQEWQSLCHNFTPWGPFICIKQGLHNSILASLSCFRFFIGEWQFFVQTPTLNDISSPNPFVLHKTILPLGFRQKSSTFPEAKLCNHNPNRSSEGRRDHLYLAFVNNMHVTGVFVVFVSDQDHKSARIYTRKSPNFRTAFAATRERSDHPSPSPLSPVPTHSPEIPAMYCLTFSPRFFPSRDLRLQTNLLISLLWLSTRESWGETETIYRPDKSSPRPIVMILERR